MKVEDWKAVLEKILQEVEKFLTSVLQEESGVAIESAESFGIKDLEKNLNKKDIFVFTTDKTHEIDVILVLSEDWFGLLSSIMMGVEEKTNNEITRDLLKKFATELSVTLKKNLRREGLQVLPGDIEVLTRKQLDKRFGQSEYFHAKMQVSGLADEDVRAEIVIGNPEARVKQTESEEKASEASEKKEEPPESDKKKKEKDQASKKAAEAKKKEGKEEVPDKKPADHDGGYGDTSKIYDSPVNTESADEPRGTSASDKLFTGMDTENMQEEGEAGKYVEEDEVFSGRRVEFDDFEHADGGNGRSRSMALLQDVEMDVSVQLGQIEMPLGKVLQLARGSIIELDKLAGEPVDILVNGSKIAHGEVVVIDEHFGVRITNLITTRERIASLK